MESVDSIGVSLRSRKKHRAEYDERMHPGLIQSSLGDWLFWNVITRR
jgi:hypothetical protein